MKFFFIFLILLSEKTTSALSYLMAPLSEAISIFLCSMQLGSLIGIGLMGKLN